MKRGFAEKQAAFKSASQIARVDTELWAKTWMFCPNCGSPHLSQFEANRPVADFFCRSCNNEYELKSQSRAFGKKVADGAYATKLERLRSNKSPSLILLHYDRVERAVINLKVVPSHFFTASIIEQRPPLGPNARRAGWVGSNILLDRIPASGQISVIEGGKVRTKSHVLQEWKKLEFLKGQSLDARGWLLEVLNCVDQIGRQEFTLQDVYEFTDVLGTKYPENYNVKAKIRQQLQRLRDHGYIDFLGSGHYRIC